MGRSLHVLIILLIIHLLFHLNNKYIYDFNKNYTNAFLFQNTSTSYPRLQNHKHLSYLIMHLKLS
jgi:hypothetical protein